MKKKLIKRRSKGIMTSTEAQNAQLELLSIKSNKAVLVEREEELKNRLSAYMEKTISPDAKGHYLMSTLNNKGERIHLQRQARKKVSLNEKAVLNYVQEHQIEGIVNKELVVAPEVTPEQVAEVLEKYAPHLLNEVEVISEKALEQVVISGEITQEEFEGMVDIQTTYAMTFIDDSRLEQ